MDGSAFSAERFIYSPHAARSSVTKRVAAPAFSFTLPAVNPVNKVLCVRTRMTGPGQANVPDLHGARPGAPPSSSRARQPSPRGSAACSTLAFTNKLSTEKHLSLLRLLNTHTHTHRNSSTSERLCLTTTSTSMAFSVPANSDLSLLKVSQLLAGAGPRLPALPPSGL